MNNYIVDVYPKKPQFLSGEQIEIQVELLNNDDCDKKFEIEIEVYHLAQRVENKKHGILLPANEQFVFNAVIDPKNTDFKGYGVDIYLYSGNDLVQEFSTSFDVVSNWRKATRYGFLSDFYSKDLGDGKDVQSMAKFHINLVQFYDWMYRHHQLVPPASEFEDIMGRKLSYEVVKEKIQLCHKYGMKAIAYGAVYASGNDFFENHRDWAYYTSDGKVIDFIGLLKIMNISPECPWHNHIINQYKSTIEDADFDGIHMDTYGYPKAAISHFGGEKKLQALEEHFTALINNTRTELEKSKEDICLIFNNVGNWPVDKVASAEQDATYIEVWDPYSRYDHVQQIIQRAKYQSNGKQVIIAAYLKPFKDCEEKDRPKAEFSAQLLTAVITANGAYHLLLGEENGILTQAYYAAHSYLDNSFVRTMRNYYDFIIRYSNIFFDNNYRDVSMTHFGGDNLEYVIENCEISVCGEADKVWMIAWEKPDCKALNFINLTGNRENIWNEGKETPTPVSNITARIQVLQDIKAVYAASPDRNMGRSENLDYRVESSERGKVLVVQLPELKVWSLLVIEFEVGQGDRSIVP